MHLKNNIPPCKVLNAQLLLHDVDRHGAPQGVAGVSQGDEIMQGEMRGFKDGEEELEGEEGEEEIRLGGGRAGECLAKSNERWDVFVVEKVAGVGVTDG